jgi:peroxiredoxin
VGRVLTLLASLALVGVVVVATVLVSVKLSARSASGPQPAPVAVDGGPARGPREAEARSGVSSGALALRVDAAMRELDLIKPLRPTRAEDFSLPMPDGRTFRLSDQRGKVVFINFWATWCPPCREEMPAMERLYAQQKNGPFTMVAVSLDANPALVGPYVERARLTFPVALDPKMDLANSYGVRALPASFVVDPRGMVVAMALGPRTWDGPAARALMEGIAR